MSPDRCVNVHHCRKNAGRPARGIGWGLGNARLTAAKAWRGAAAGTAWQAAMREARAHLARAQGDDELARTLLEAVGRGFIAAGQPLDAERCESFAKELLSTV